MSTTVQIEVDSLYERHQRLLEIEELIEHLLEETNPAERPLAQQLGDLARELVENLEDVLDSAQSQAAMLDVRAHGAVPWDEVEAELGR